MIVKFLGVETEAIILVKKYIRTFRFKEERTTLQEGLMKIALFNAFAEELYRKV